MVLHAKIQNFECLKLQHAISPSSKVLFLTKFVGLDSNSNLVSMVRILPQSKMFMKIWHAF